MESNNNNVELMVNSINSFRNENNTYEKKIKINKDKIKNLEKILWKKCNHKWVKDDWDSYDNVNKYCSICNLWKSRFMYE